MKGGGGTRSLLKIPQKISVEEKTAEMKQSHGEALQDKKSDVEAQKKMIG